jgi:hypothetical protein
MHAQKGIGALRQSCPVQWVEVLWTAHALHSKFSDNTKYVQRSEAPSEYFVAY